MWMLKQNIQNPAFIQNPPLFLKIPANHFRLPIILREWSIRTLCGSVSTYKTFLRGYPNKTSFTSTMEEGMDFDSCSRKPTHVVSALITRNSIVKQWRNKLEVYECSTITTRTSENSSALFGKNKAFIDIVQFKWRQEQYLVHYIEKWGSKCKLPCRNSSGIHLCSYTDQLKNIFITYIHTYIQYIDIYVWIDFRSR